MKKGVFVLGIIVSFFVGCDSESLYDSTKSTSTPTSNVSTNLSEISGVVKASYIKGMQICEKDTQNCVMSDEKGKFKINVASNYLELKIADKKFAVVDINNSNCEITPKLLADGNQTLASYIGALLHFIGNCDINADECDISNINEIDLVGEGETLIDKLKNNLTISSDINISIDNRIRQITLKDAIIYALNNPFLIGKNELIYKGDRYNLIYDINNNSIKSDFIFGDFSGESLNLTNIKDNVFFKDTEDWGMYFFLTKNIAVELTDNGMVKFGLINPIKYNDASIICNKSFALISNIPKIFSITCNEDKKDGNFTLSLPNFSGNFINVSGNWKMEGEKFILNYGDTQGTLNILANESGTFINISFADTNEFGVETNPVVLDDGKFYYVSYSTSVFSSSFCYGEADVNSESVTFKDFECVGTTPQEITYTNFSLNPSFGGKDFSGIFISNNFLGSLSNSGGYLFGYDFESSKFYVGSNKPIK